MHPLIMRIDRINRLAVFESAGRLGSFTAAANELGMTQPAVTQQIRDLERTLGRSLFDRTANRSRLNAPGAALLRSVQQGFDAIESGLNELEELHTMFVLACNPGVAQGLLVPRLGELQAVLGELDLRLWLYDRDSELTLGRFDAVIGLPTKATAGLAGQDLFAESVIPVASADLALTLGLDSTSRPEDLPHDRLLHLDGHDRTWMTWADWFAASSLLGPSDRRSPVLYNNHALLLQDVAAGRGIGLAWRHLSDELLVSGMIVPVGREVTKPESRYRLSWPAATPSDRTDAIRTFLQTLLNLS